MRAFVLLLLVALPGRALADDTERARRFFRAGSIAYERGRFAEAARAFEEAYRIGVQSLPILIIVNIFVGTNLAVQGNNAFEQLGGQSMVGTFVALAGVREMAPIMVASMVAAKAGTEMASQIAVITWLGTLIVANLLAAVDKPGPAEWLLRTIVYRPRRGTVTPSSEANTAT